MCVIDSLSSPPTQHADAAIIASNELSGPLLTVSLTVRDQTGGLQGRYSSAARTAADPPSRPPVAEHPVGRKTQTTQERRVVRVLYPEGTADHAIAGQRIESGVPDARPSAPAQCDQPSPDATRTVPFRVLLVWLHRGQLRTQTWHSGCM